MGAPIDTIEPTLGFTIQTLQHPTGYTLHVWDVGGQKSLRAYWRNYFESTDGLIFVVDSTDSRRLKDCRESLAQLLEEERLAAATLLILCNKQDQDNALSEEDLARLLNLDALLTKFSSNLRHYKILPCSAVTGQGLSSGLDWLVQDIASRIYLLA
jgi:ADP-ribosylation factor-like protein 2